MLHATFDYGDQLNPERPAMMRRHFLMTLIVGCACALAPAADKPGKSPKPDKPPTPTPEERTGGATWRFKLQRGPRVITGTFRVLDKQIFFNNKQIGTIEPKDEDETLLTFTGLKQLNGSATLGKLSTNPPGASGTLRRTDGTTWTMRVTITKE
jgi:hypothetical protein